MRRQLVSALLSLIFAGVCAADPPRLTNGEWSPCLGQQLPYKVIASRMVAEAIALQGIAVDREFYPWARSMQMAEHGQRDGSAQQQAGSDVLYQRFGGGKRLLPCSTARITVLTGARLPTCRVFASPAPVVMTTVKLSASRSQRTTSGQPGNQCWNSLSPTDCRLGGPVANAQGG
jgi:hypothetical protein